MGGRDQSGQEKKKKRETERERERERERDRERERLQGACRGVSGGARLFAGEEIGVRRDKRNWVGEKGGSAQANRVVPFTNRPPITRRLDQSAFWVERLA